jgi:hypothetical protein
VTCGATSLTPIGAGPHSGLAPFSMQYLLGFGTLLIVILVQQYVMATGAKRSGATLCFSAETKGGSTSLAMTVSHVWDIPIGEPA